MLAWLKRLLYGPPPADQPEFTFARLYQTHDGAHTQQSRGPCDGSAFYELVTKPDVSVEVQPGLGTLVRRHFNTPHGSGTEEICAHGVYL